MSHETDGRSKNEEDLTGIFWEGFRSLVFEDWVEGNLDSLREWEGVYLRRIAAGYMANVAAFCLEYVRAAGRMAAWEPEMGAQVNHRIWKAFQEVSGDLMKETWSPELETFHEDVGEKVQEAQERLDALETGML
jgi:hypothetical protein